MKRLFDIPLCAILVTLAGCGTSPPTNFYALKQVPPAEAAHAGRPGGAPIVVDSVKIPPMLDRAELVSLTGSNRVIVDGESRWAAPLDEMVRDVLVEDLKSRLPAGIVLSGDDMAGEQPKRDLIVNIRQFAPEGGQVTLDADWILLAGSSRNTQPRDEHIVAGEGVGGPDRQASAMSQALGRLADRIAAAIEHQPEAHR